MQTLIGQTLSHYKILSRIGEDGSGTLYKAFDTERDRAVTLKTLALQVTADPTLRARVERDALAASALQHPNIARIYEFSQSEDIDFVVMEGQEGESLDEFLRGRPSRFSLLRYAGQMASALAAGHGAGIIHGPLDPSRIFIHDEQLTILDYGFGVLEAPPESEQDRKALFGRAAAYVSPEQIRGSPPDQRSDIFSFGAVLYHMSKGRPPFYEVTLEATWEAIIKNRPEPIRQGGSQGVRGMDRLLKRCMKKNARSRFQSMAEIDSLLAGMEEFYLRNPGYELSLFDRYSGPILKTALVVLAVGAAALLWQARAVKEEPYAAIGSRFLPVTRDKGLDAEPAISADGSLLAYASDRNSDGNLDVWVQPSGGGQPLQLTNDPADDREPAFSPDGATIVFRSDRSGGGIYQVPSKGGTARLVAPEGRRPRFSPDGRWIAYWTAPPDLSPKTTPGAYKIFIIPAAGGAPQQIRPEFAYCAQPIWSPDSKSLLFIGKPDPLRNGPKQFDWWVSSIESGKYRKTGAFPLYRRESLLPPSGVLPPADWKGNYVFFSTPGTAASSIWRAGIDPIEWTIPARPVKVTSGAGIEIDPMLAGGGLTAGGNLVFSRQSYNAGVWAFPVQANEGKATGTVKRLTRASGIDLSPSLSADGARLLFQSYRSGAYNTMLLDLHAGKESLVSAGSAEQIWPTISPDGSKAAWTEPRLGGRFEQFYRKIGGNITENLCGQCGLAVSGWSPDGKSALLDDFPPGSPRLAVALMELRGLKKTVLLQDDRYELYQARFSPDGRWIVFVARAESGSTRIYIAAYQGPERISSRGWIEITGGNGWETRPQWSPDGSLVYYTSRRDGNRCVWAQRLNAVHRPSGEAFAVYHFHIMRRSPAALPFDDTDLFVARDQILVSLAELAGNIWSAKVPN